MLQWAVERAGVTPGDVRGRFARYDDWLAGTVQPTLKQLQDFARYTYAAVGYFFQSQPPDLGLPIPDFRTADGTRPGDPSPDLLDTVYVCQQRQEWYASYARSVGAEPLPFVGRLSVRDDVAEAAEAIRRAIGLDLSVRRRLSTWEDALRQLIHLADDSGVLVMVSGVVGSNNTRKLDAEEFRGFALSDRLAPLVFVNGADTKSAQMFTLAHELAHLWLGQSALSDSTAAKVADGDVEGWCNRVAAETLVPLEGFRQEYRPGEPVGREMQRLAHVFKVSTLVVLRRMFDAGGLAREEFWRLYREEVGRLVAIMRAKDPGGGDYYRTTTGRVSHRFTRAIVTSAVEGRSSFTEAFGLLGCKKMSTFAELGQHVGVDVGGGSG
ncbi:MAG TPA: ImmA/IrrE family metallo-endopeptidase [Tepidisphaeraceae bacterium]|nr:ImmA/IrrE family metallo-endopeptidase [Tepidisphaeraceae bacterium]